MPDYLIVTKPKASANSLFNLVRMRSSLTHSGSICCQSYKNGENESLVIEVENTRDWHSANGVDIFSHVFPAADSKHHHTHHHYGVDGAHLGYRVFVQNCRIALNRPYFFMKSEENEGSQIFGRSFLYCPNLIHCILYLKMLL